jgi:hypothetical protein
VFAYIGSTRTQGRITAGENLQHDSSYIFKPNMAFEGRVAGEIVRFYTLRARSLLRDRDLEQFSWQLFAPIRKQYTDLAFMVLCKSPEGC